jgi:hypothetical protein
MRFLNISQNKFDPYVCLPPAFTVVSCFAYSSTLKIEATCSSEISVDFQRTMWLISQKITQVPLHPEATLKEVICNRHLNEQWFELTAKCRGYRIYVVEGSNSHNGLDMNTRI